jgi:hypothetical protein
LKTVENQNVDWRLEVFDSDRGLCQEMQEVGEKKKEGGLLNMENPGRVFICSAMHRYFAMNS